MYLQTLIRADEQDDAFLSSACTEHFIHYLVVLYIKSPVAEHILNLNLSFKHAGILPINTQIKMPGLNYYEKNTESVSKQQHLLHFISTNLRFMSDWSCFGAL